MEAHTYQDAADAAAGATYAEVAAQTQGATYAQAADLLASTAKADNFALQSSDGRDESFGGGDRVEPDLSEGLVPARNEADRADQLARDRQVSRHGGNLGDTHDASPISAGPGLESPGDAASVGEPEAPAGRFFPPAAPGSRGVA